MKYLNEIIKFIGTAKYDEWGGGYIWGYDKKDDTQMIAQLRKPRKDIIVNEVLSIRGWGAIQNMFPTIKDGVEFQDELGKFIAEAINEKIQRINENNPNK
jgi:hypothetical protein